MTRKRVGALLFCALSLFYAAQIADIPQLPVDALEAMNARSLPWALAGAGVLFSIALFVLGGKPNESSALKTDSTHGSSRHAVTALLLLAWTGLYGATLDWIGFFLATLSFLVGGFLLLGERRGRVIAATALGTAGTLYLLLHFGLGLYLPQGSLWSLLASPKI